VNQIGPAAPTQPADHAGQRTEHGTGLHAANGAGPQSWFTKPPRPDAVEPRAPQPAEPAGYDAPQPGSRHGAEAPDHDDRLRLAESLRESAAGVWRLADQLAERHARLEPVVVDLAEVVASVARCCRLLEADAAGYNPRAQRRMVQATGHADALTGRLTDVFSALQQRYGTHDDTPA
jgi:hypothetical protein